WYTIYRIKNRADKPTQVVIRSWCNFLLPTLIAQNAVISNTTVIPFIVAYIGGRKPILSTLGIFTPNKIATMTGTAIDIAVIHRLIFRSLAEIGSMIPIE